MSTLDVNSQLLVVPSSLDIGWRVVAVDLDGTILPSSLQVSPLTQAVLVAVASAGIQIIIATGRMFSSALPHAKALGMEGPLIAYQGAFIKEVASERVLYHRPLPVSLAREVLLYLEGEIGGRGVNVYLDDILYVQEWTNQLRMYQKAAQVEVRAVGSLSRFLTRPTTKIVVAGDPERLDRLGMAVRTVFGDRIYVTKSLPPFLEIANAEVSKAKALAFLGDRLGFSSEDVLAFGDSFNDVDMLSWAGLGVAMGNAPEEVKASADLVCGSVDEDGVGRFLLGLGGQPSL